MLGIVLMIVKVIGLLLLGILGLFLGLILLILFLPIPYRVWLKGDSGEPETLAYSVKIFGIQIVPKKERKQRRGKRKRGGRSAKDPQTEAATGRGSEPVSGQQPDAPLPQGSPQTECPVGQHPQKPEQTERPVGQREQEEQKSPKKRKRARSSGNREKNNAGRDVRGMMDRFRAEFTDEGNRRALRHVCSEIAYLLRHFGPRRVRGDVSFSLGDPANTGYVTAALSICPFSYGKDCRIIPDFEAEQLFIRGWLDIRGHVRSVHVLIAGLRLLFDKDIRKIIRKIMKKK